MARRFHLTKQQIMKLFCSSLRNSDFQSERSVPQNENTRCSTSFDYLEADIEPLGIVPGISASEMQMALHERLLPTANTMEPHKAMREVKVRNRFGDFSTHSSVINEERDLLSYKKSFEIR